MKVCLAVVSPYTPLGAQRARGVFPILNHYFRFAVYSQCAISRDLHGSNALSGEFINKNSSELALHEAHYTPMEALSSGGFPLLHNFLQQGDSPTFNPISAARGRTSYDVELCGCSVPTVALMSVALIAMPAIIEIAR